MMSRLIVIGCVVCGFPIVIDAQRLDTWTTMSSLLSASTFRVRRQVSEAASTAVEIEHDNSKRKRLMASSRIHNIFILLHDGSTAEEKIECIFCFCFCDDDDYNKISRELNKNK